MALCAFETQGGDCRSLHAVESDDVALLFHGLHQPLALYLSKFLLVDVDVSGDVVGINQVIEVDDDDTRLHRLVHHGDKSLGIGGGDQDGIHLLGDQVFDVSDLFLDRVVRLGDDQLLDHVLFLGGCILGLRHHLDPPGVAEAEVAQADHEPAGLLGFFPASGGHRH